MGWTTAVAGNIQHWAEYSLPARPIYHPGTCAENDWSHGRFSRRTEGVLLGISRSTAHIAIACSFHSADDLDVRLNQLHTIGYTAKLHSIGGWNSSTKSNHQCLYHLSRNFLLRLEQLHKPENQTLAKTDRRLEQLHQIALSI